MFAAPVVRIILDLGCFVDSYGIAFHYPVDSGLTINDVLVGFKRNVFNSDMAVVNDACLVG